MRSQAGQKRSSKAPPPAPPAPRVAHVVKDKAEVKPYAKCAATCVNTLQGAAMQVRARRLKGWVWAGFGSRHLESRYKAAARLDLEVSAGWAIPSSRGVWGGDALLLSTEALR